MIHLFIFFLLKILFFFLSIKMSDNLVLTLLGAVGIGALVMGMNKDDEIKEDFWNSIQLSAKRETVKVTVDKKTGKRTESVVPFNDTAVTTQKSLKQMQKSQNQQLMQKLASNQKLSFGGPVEKYEPRENYQNVHENFELPYHQALGSSQVTGDNYVSYPNFEQSVTQPSPSLNLPAQIRYNPPSLDKMGITESFQCNRPMSNMDHANVVEGFMSFDKTNPNPGSGYAYGNYNTVVADAEKSKTATNLQSQLPVGTMDSQGENTMLFDRYITVPGKAAGRFNRGNGIVDRIRGDLPVCVDPCQKGWFASPGKPSDLAIGALSYIGGEGSASNELTNFVQINGGFPSIKPSTQDTNAVTNMLSQTTPSSGLVQVSSFH
jgi:hypothetical protein